MKNINLLVTLIGIISMVACNPFDRSSGSFMKISLKGNEQRMVIRSDDMSLDIKYSGDIVFNDEETAIEKITPGGYLDYTKNGKRLLAEAGRDGDVVYKFYNDENYLTEDGSGKKFLVEAIREMISQGLFINGRMERLYQEGGIPLLLAEVKRTKADNVKRKYLEFILQSDSVSQQEMIAISSVIAKTMGSDDDKRKILERIPAHYLHDSITVEAYFAAMESTGSDNDKANALKKTLNEPLADPAFKWWLKAAGSIHSDNDKANLLKNLVETEDLPQESYNSLLEVISTINADNDKAHVLEILIDKETGQGEQFYRLLTVISKINSDNDKANVFKKLAEKNISTEEDWVGFINATTSISSDNDKANVLSAISKNMPRSENVIAAYMKSSRTISSDHDYQRTVKSLQ